MMYCNCTVDIFLFKIILANKKGLEIKKYEWYKIPFLEMEKEKKSKNVQRHKERKY